MRRVSRPISRKDAVALGSASESEYHIRLAFDLDYLEQETFDELTANVREVKRMLAGFLRRLDGKS